ncbi:unnamed protein product [Rhizoctonia solani]|uniref:Uncharacterized protein n=1 Tax=Rhizoctonia solani TaxID=456999 RepID=A0A8H3HW76_9AGAM|nr:unnamed protein product [Rhizoctonia solani]
MPTTNNHAHATCHISIDDLPKPLPSLTSINRVFKMLSEDESWYPEETILEGEGLRPRGEFAGAGYERVAVSFAFMSEGEIVPIGPHAQGKEYQSLELLAAVSNSKGRQGMFAQAVWFGEGGAPWKWMRIGGIEKVILYDGLAHPFRSGLEPCVGVRTARGHYFLTIPHPDYRDAWNRDSNLWISKPPPLILYSDLGHAGNIQQIRLIHFFLCAFVRSAVHPSKWLVAFPPSAQSTPVLLWELIPYTSMKWDPSITTHPRYTLRRHYETASRTIEFLSKTSSLSLNRWTMEAKEEVRLGQKFGQSLHAHFEELEGAYEKGVRDQRTTEGRIKRRLRVLGWLEDDFNFVPPQSKEWALLVNKSAPLTDQEWSELYLKLGPLLFSNRTRVQKAQRENNLARQNVLLSEFLASLKADPLWHPLQSFIKAVRINRQPRAMTAFLNTYPFPSNELAKTWPFFVHVGNTEMSDSELKAMFENDQERIKAHIANWRIDIEVTLANRLMEERGVRTMTEAEPLCRVEVNRSDEDTKALPLHTQLLLRADSVFTDGSPKCAPLYYPEFVPTKPQFVSGHGRPIIPLAKFCRAPEPERVARVLLGELGLEKASYLEVAAFGERFICFRCPPRSRELMNWKGILVHYLDEQRFWNLATQNGPRFKTMTPIPMKCAHGLTSAGDLPPVELLTRSSVKLWNLAMSQLQFQEDKYFCFPCKNVGYAYFGNDVKVLRRHMRAVHDCRSDILEGVHYGLINEGGTFLETGAAWRTRWNEFDHAEGIWSGDESE